MVFLPTGVHQSLTRRTPVATPRRHKSAAREQSSAPVSASRAVKDGTTTERVYHANDLRVQLPLAAPHVKNMPPVECEQKLYRQNRTVEQQRRQNRTST